MKQKLELTWINKDQRPKLEPRVLVQDSTLSVLAEARRDGDHFDNRLIFGDNLLGLKALEHELAGKIKCVYLDPPYNTGSAFEHYDDGIEHSIWLSLMRERLECIRMLLADDGFCFVQIDYRESARLKLVLDEVFGEGCFRNEIIVGRGTKNIQSQFDDIDSLASGHDTIYLYARNSSSRLKTLFAELETPQDGKWDTFWRGTDRPTMRYELLGTKPDKGQWRWSKDKAEKAVENYRKYLELYAEKLTLDQYWGELIAESGDEPDFVRKSAEGTLQYYVGPRNYKMLSDVWFDTRVLGKITDFPHEKHEQLIERIIGWTTKPNDLVLDSFAGSGTTGAVAHKMGRRWIMIEMGEHCHTHIIPRLKKVIDGTDQGGISKAVGWKGGGGFRYYRLAPTLIKKDRWGNEVINPQFNAEMVAEAVCKLEGFTYAPSEGEFWRQGQSTENDFIYVTTQTLSVEQLDRISEEVGPQRSLLVCCGAWRAKDLGRWANLSLKKIPKAVLDKAEWDRDDYALAVSQLPVVEEDGDADDAEPEAVPKGKAKRAAGQGSLFEENSAPKKTKKGLRQ